MHAKSILKAWLYLHQEDRSLADAVGRLSEVVFVDGEGELQHLLFSALVEDRIGQDLGNIYLFKIVLAMVNVATCFRMVSCT